jgi:hypothetical protein
MSNLKIIVPLFVVAGLFTFILPMLLIWFVNDVQTNITIEGSSAGVWTVFQHGMTMIATIFGETSWVIGIILIVIALVLIFGGVIVAFKRMA